MSDQPARVKVGLKLPNCGGMFYGPEWATADNILRLAAVARKAGFESVWLNDHLATPTEHQQLKAPPMLDCMLSAAAIAASVPDITVGIAAVILPLRDPVVFTKEVITLDHFFPGRTVVAVGVGQFESEFEAVGSDLFHRRGRVSNEYLNLMEILLTTSPATYEGEFRSVKEADFHPKSDPARPPVIWVGGDSVAGARRARRYGQSWIISTKVAPEQVPDLLNPNGELGPGFRFPIALSTSVCPPWDVGAVDDADLHRHPVTFEGDAETVAKGINTYIRAGISYLLLAFRSPDIEAAEVGMAWFNNDVRPLLAESATV